MPYKDPEQARAARRRRYLAKRPELIAYSCQYDKARRAINPDAYRAIQFKRRYGLKLEQIHLMLALQGGKCPLCFKKLKFGTKSVHVDHCHKTGKVRGVLCASCNVTLGKFGDDPARLRAAADYIETADPLKDLGFG